MLSEEWLNRQVRTVYAHWVDRIPQEELAAKCVERTLWMIGNYREGEDPEQYRAYIEKEVQSHMNWDNQE